MVMIIINHLKSISSEHGRKTKMYFVKLTGLVILLFSHFPPFFLASKRALVFFLLNPNRLVMPSSRSYEEQ
jgi:hypothetical protein